MASAKVAVARPLPPQPWRMPLRPDDYPDRRPLLTEEERLLLADYLAMCRGAGGGNRAIRLLPRLHRFDQPLRDSDRLLHTARSTGPLARMRQYVFGLMVTHDLSLWGWSPDLWEAAISGTSTTPRARHLKRWMQYLAYVLAGVLRVDDRFPVWEMARAVFGAATVQPEVERLVAPSLAIGYGATASTTERLRHVCALALLVNRNPYVDALTGEVLRQVQALQGGGSSRRALLRLQSTLCQLGVLDAPILPYDAAPPWATIPVNPDTINISPTWIAWVRAVLEQTPGLSATRLKNMRLYLRVAGRWLFRYHPEVSSPLHWDERLAQEYVLYTCNATCYDLTFPDEASLRGKHALLGKPLTARTIDERLGVMRCFFTHLRQRSYRVDGQPQPRVTPTWLPAEAFRTPETIRAAIGPNPRDVPEDAWLKLVWQACTLSAETLGGVRHSAHFPLAYYRAVALVWVTAGRRADEIRRLSVGCVSRDWAPEMVDEAGQQIEPAEELCYLRVPTNKYTGEFMAPIPVYVADAIEAWERQRPPDQAALVDRKTHKLTHYLFMYRNKLMGAEFINNSVIPALCKAANISPTDAVGRITSHRNRASTATWLREMGMSASDIGRILGHTNPSTTLPWYMRESKHRLGRAYRKANPLDRQVAALLDPEAMKKRDPCVFYYLADGPDGRPRMCGSPDFAVCHHQLQCIECEMFIDAEQAEVIERRPHVLTIAVPIPLPPQVAADLDARDEVGQEALTRDVEPPPVPDPAFHFNKKAPPRRSASDVEQLQERLCALEDELTHKPGKGDRRNAAVRSLMEEIGTVKAQIDLRERSV